MKKMSKIKFITHEEHLAKMFKKPGFKEGYDALEPKFKIIDALIQARIDRKISQRECARQIGIVQSSLARFESGKSNPTLSSLQKIAKNLGQVITVQPIKVVRT